MTSREIGLYAIVFVGIVLIIAIDVWFLRHLRRHVGRVWSGDYVEEQMKKTVRPRSAMVRSVLLLLASFAMLGFAWRSWAAAPWNETWALLATIATAWFAGAFLTWKLPEIQEHREEKKPIMLRFHRYSAIFMAVVFGGGWLVNRTIGGEALGYGVLPQASYLSLAGLMVLFCLSYYAAMREPGRKDTKYWIAGLAAFLLLLFGGPPAWSSFAPENSDALSTSTSSSSRSVRSKVSSRAVSKSSRAESSSAKFLEERGILLPTTFKGAAWYTSEGEPAIGEYIYPPADPDHTVPYRNAEWGVALDIPFHDSWGTNLFAIRPFEEDPEGKSLHFGPLVMCSGGSHCRHQYMTVLPAQSRAATEQSIRDSSRWNSEFPVLDLEFRTIGGKNVFVYRWEEMQPHVFMMVMGPSHNYEFLVTKEEYLPDPQAYLEEIVASMEFLD